MYAQLLGQRRAFQSCFVNTAARLSFVSVNCALGACCSPLHYGWWGAEVSAQWSYWLLRRGGSYWKDEILAGLSRDRGKKKKLVGYLNKPFAFRPVWIAGKWTQCARWTEVGHSKQYTLWLDLPPHNHVGVCLICCRVPGKLKQFVLDLHSGKLHREFHHGPDPTDVAPGQVRLPQIRVVWPFNEDFFFFPCHSGTLFLKEKSAMETWCCHFCSAVSLKASLG